MGKITLKGWANSVGFPRSTQSVGVWSLLLCVLLLYLVTLDNGFQPEELRGGDLITHQYAQVQARPGNAPGYPLYTMGGWAWFHSLRWLLSATDLPSLNPIPLLSSYSLLWALIAIWFFYQITAKFVALVCNQSIVVAEQEPLLGAAQSSTGQSDTGQSDTGQSSVASHVRPVAHLLPWLLSAFYATTYLFWFYATTTEQYTSAIAQTLAIVYVYLGLQNPTQQVGKSASQPVSQSASQQPPATSHKIPASLFVLALLSGLSLAHMLTVAFIVPPLVLVIVWQYPWLMRSLPAIVGSILAAALPLISYLYIYIRGGQHSEWWGEGDWTTPNEWFWSFVSTAQGRDELARGFESWCGPLAGGFPEGIWHELSLPILLLGLVGIAFLGKRTALFFYGTLIIYLIFCWMYRCGNWFQVILPAYPLILFGLIPLTVRFETWVRAQRPWLRTIPYLLLIAAILWRLDASWPQVNSRHRADDSAFEGVAHLLHDSLPFGVALYATLDNALALQYLNQIGSVRPDLEIVDHKEARRRIDNGQFVLTTYAATPQLLAEMREEATIGLWSFSPRWLALQDASVVDEDSYGDPAVVLNYPIEPGVELVGYSFLRPATAQLGLTSPKPTLDLMLYWRLDDNGRWPDGLSISVRPTSNGSFLPLSTVQLEAAPEAIIQQDQSRPMQGLEPISRIPAGQVFGDGYSLPLPSLGSADGAMVILYRETDAGFANVAEVQIAVE